MRYRLRVMAAIASSIAVFGTAIACISVTRYSLLGDEAADNLKFIPGTSFGFEAAHLVEPPIPGLKSIDNYSSEPRYYQAQWYIEAVRGPKFLDEDQIRLAWLKHLREAAEADGLSAQQVATLGRMREAESGDAAYALGDQVPQAVRLYTAGAVDFDRENFEAAVSRFQSVLDLSPDEARPRALWAAFMLGRSEARLQQPEAAAGAFRLTRDWAGRGVPDSQGLAVASYGEEARLHILAAQALAADDDFSTDAEVRHRYAEEIEASMRLYADQAAYGSAYGTSSLGFVASSVLQSAERIGAVLDDPLAVRVLFAYEDARGRPYENYAPLYDLSEEEKNPPIVETQLVIAIKAHGVAGLPNVDRIAELLYQDGQFDLAFELADKLDTPLAYWLRAKQSVRQGDLPGAAENYRHAIAAFPTAEADPALTDQRRRRLVGEAGAVAMGRGEFLQALGLLGASGYLDEASYVAERILTIEELTGFLADTAGAPPSIDPNTRLMLRDLLARRLMRAGRFDEALPYFNDTETADEARAYAADLRAAVQAGTDVERAQAMFDAAIIARINGMEILGTSLAPDDAGWAWSAPRWSDGAKPGLFTTQAELDRYRRNAPVPNDRFHYRYIAADEAETAASLLPSRSQAFAAVLCRATGWMLKTETKERGEPAEPKAKALYARYLKAGAVVPWATHFGYGCPEPDFAAAARLPSLRFDRALGRLLHRRLTYAVAGGTLAVILGAGFLFVRRRRARRMGPGTA